MERIRARWNIPADAATYGCTTVTLKAVLEDGAGLVEWQRLAADKG